MRSLLVYLCGPITGLSYREATARREWFAARIREMGHIPLSPMRGKQHLLRRRNLSPEGYEDDVISNARSIVARDSWDVTRSDVLLVDFLDAERVSIGSVMEIAWAWLRHKLVIVLMKKGNLHRHAFIEQCASYIVEDEEKALEILEYAGATLQGEEADE